MPVAKMKVLIRADSFMMKGVSLEFCVYCRRQGRLVLKN
jgi:hypothetical protein